MLIILGQILSIVEIIAYTALALIGLTHYQSASRDFRLITVYCIVAAICNLIPVAMFITKMKYNNLWILHLFTLAEVLIVTQLILFWHQSELWKRISKLFLLVFIFLWIAAKLSIEAFTTYDSYTAALAHLFLCLNLVVISNHQFTLYRGANDPLFIAINGFILYFAGNILFVAASQLFTVFNLATIGPLWILHYFVNMVFYIMMLAAFLIRFKLIRKRPAHT